MPTYNWMTPHWLVQAEKGERGARPALGQRRWTDKDDILTDHVLEFDWPEIPRGVGADYEGERALRVFLEITDGPEKRSLAPGAVLFARLSGADAARAGLKKDDEFLVVPVKFFVWVAGALSFDKKVLLALSTPIMERRLTHKDAEEVWGEIVWITPMKKGDRKYYYSVLPLVGMGGVIDPRKGNPGLYAPIQPDPYRHLVWDVVDEVIDTGTSAWGTDAASGDGAASIFALKLRLINFLRDLADLYQEEDFELMIEDGGFDRGEVHKAVSNGFGQHLPDSGKVLREKWLERADVEDGLKTLVRGMRSGRIIGYSQALSLILHHAGQGWTNPQEWGDLLVKLAWRASCLDGAAELRRMQRTPGVTDADIRDAARKLYMAGKISRRELVLFGETSGEADPYADTDLWEGLAEELEVELKGEPKRPGVLAQHGFYFTD